MVTIVQVWRIAEAFFRPHGTSPPGAHGACGRLRGPRHRTDHGELLWRTVRRESPVTRQIALDLLRKLTLTVL
jgi:hypothetical protein